MNVLEAGNKVFQLRFFPDGRRLLVGLVSQEGIPTFEVWPLPAGDRVALRTRTLSLHSWWYESLYGNAVAIHPGGERCYLAWDGRLSAYRTADGASLPAPRVKAHQVVLSPDGRRLITVCRDSTRRQLSALTVDAKGGKLAWKTSLSPVFRHVAGFLPDGEHFVTVDDAVRIRTFTDDEERAAARYPTYNARQPQISPDGRYLGVIGYSCMYVYDLAALGKPRRIGGQRSCGDFESFAFHPDGRTLAVIHGGPTLVKVYDLESMRQVHTYKWKLGPLNCVAFSPDGTMGAAGGDPGRIVIWDVDR